MTAAGHKLTAFLTLPGRLGRIIAEASPVSIAIALTSLTAAGLFIAVDVVRSVSESSAHRHLLAQIQPAGLRPLSETFVASASAMTIAPEIATAGAAVIEDTSAVVGGIVQRGLGAFGAAAAASAIGFRRRKVQAPRPQSQPLVPDNVLAAMPGAVAWWNAEGTLIRCNPQFEDMLLDGTAGEDVDYTLVLRRMMQIGTVEMLASDDNSRRFEIHQLHGAWLLVEERAIAGGGFLTMITDVSERRKNDLLLASVQEEQRQLARRYHEEKLRAEAASHAKTAFLAHLSHDIRTPLNHIIGFADLIRHQTYGPMGDARYLTYIDTIKGSGEKLLAFFASILDFAELESGKRELQEDAIDVDELLNAAARRFKAQASRAGIALTVGVPTGAAVLGDRFCIERMLGNVLENALRFTPSGGRVSLAAYAASDGVLLEIADTGVGMTGERLSALSQPFALGDATVAPEHGGYGLGLPIARAIAEQSGGRLAIDSRPGLGTTVAITLPVLAASQQQAA